jgi:outer membrane murein-binding lipoprotein Lpp
MVTQRLWLGFLLLAGGSVAQAQVEPQLHETTASPRPLTPLGGKAIVTAARERDRQVARKPDCSHLVHEVYARAGYPYPYASSFDLYAGVSSFVRVTRPQSGDLIVWRGHVGIVVDPVEHSFYSSVRSGLRTEFYDTSQWKARGPARFYRYAVAKPSTFVLAGNRAAKPPSEPALANPAPVVEGAHENQPDSTNPMREDSDSTSSAAMSAVSPPAPAKFEIPSSILVASAQEKPSQEEIASAVSELNSATGDLLREQNPSQLGRKLIIYDGLTVERAKLSGKHGSVQARIESRVTFTADRIEQTHRHESLRLDLVRTSEGWQVLAPKNAVYVPRDVAVRMLASRLASLTQEGNATDTDSVAAQAQIVRVLSTLFD